jgi:hypothetical protein
MPRERLQPRPEWAEYVRRLVDAAPPLSPSQVDRLVVLLQVAAPPGKDRNLSAS